MKKLLTLTILGALCLGVVGCASSGSTATSAANTPMTLDEALQKSAETRQKLMDAKEAYENAKAAAEASQENNSSFSTEMAKQAVQSKIDESKQKLQNEANAWKEVLN